MKRKLERIRRKIAAGFYELPTIKESIAEKIIKEGEDRRW